MERWNHRANLSLRSKTIFVYLPSWRLLANDDDIFVLLMICFLPESSCRWVQKLKVSIVSVIYFSTNIWSEFVHFCEHLVTPHLKLYFIRLFVCPTVFTDNGHEGTQWTRNETPWKIGLYNRIAYIEYSKPLPEPLNEPDTCDLRS